jgi:FtsZ-interacting cell division protein ZipA
VKDMTEQNHESNWFQDNLRIIISVAIVILLVFAIYSYSKRNARTDVVVDDTPTEEIAMTADSDTEIDEIIDEIKDEEVATEEEKTAVAMEDTTSEQVAEEVQNQNETEEEQGQQETKESGTEVETITQEEQIEESTNTTSEESNMPEADENIPENSEAAKTALREIIESHMHKQQESTVVVKEGSIVITATYGDSMTTMARKATAEYISKNNISGLTPAHKIYIEDYLRKSVTPQHIIPGTTLEFSNTLINSAIENSKTLTDAQLQNLNTYAQYVPGL